ncbi:tRNA uridine-5-carboxymethylaminomethyl(34) synthesis GTPase MnmE [Helicobacter didelphidarum]|uniref:tRNA modification GTPase MnmE n=1 Tax=Helicobacter didelphidarum TaxID=2040648 RepID=A0A3D8INH1_9HELI|nr:tRNA uridine-5-carboxymethylaminomethyl(34) synthesis GTPase MnmE [Helicobacter didelphidarum]RDU66762.1 tRNA uridine-5-carboxymethylaminomethyl(34) synthesis GTPase MnmE [Helicobacter didelphidarum]
MDTIVAISTALAKSAISIVRLSGKDSLRIVSNLLKKQQGQIHTSQSLCNDINLMPRQATLRNIYDEYGRMIDKAIIIYFKAPLSFNGEDIIEIQSHGGKLIAQEILRVCTYYGARLANAGEFSRRAFRNGKLDLLELDATISLINNTNANFTQLLARNLSGECSKMLDEIRLQIIEIIAQMEVNIDYSEEDLDENILEKSLQVLDNIIQRFSTILESTKHYNRLQNLKLCILGKPNVGKSSLLNLLLLRQRAIVSNLAGTTRDAISEIIDIGGNLITIIDTAGIRDSGDFIEQEGVKQSFEYAKQSEILLCVFDNSEPMEKEDFDILDFLSQDSLKDKFILVVLNKNDLIKKNTHDFTHFNTISINTKDIQNASLIKNKIQDILTMQIDQNTFILTNNTQRILLESALHNLQNAIISLQHFQIELVSFELTQALQSLGQITKPYNVEDILDSLFSQFCVGK